MTTPRVANLYHKVHVTVERRKTSRFYAVNVRSKFPIGFAREDVGAVLVEEINVGEIVMKKLEI